MTAKSHSQGHPIECIEGVGWVYSDNKELVEGNSRMCAKCNQPPTVEGHDACLGHIKGATSVCCGHGVTEPVIVRASDKYTPLYKGTSRTGVVIEGDLQYNAVYDTIHIESRTTCKREEVVPETLNVKYHGHDWHSIDEVLEILNKRLRSQ
jgi:hypothetical protein